MEVTVSIQNSDVGKYLKLFKDDKFVMGMPLESNQVKDCVAACTVINVLEVLGIKYKLLMEV